MRRFTLTSFALALLLSLSGSVQAKGFLDADDWIPLELVDQKAAALTDRTVADYSIKELLAMPPTLGTLGIMRRRVVLESEKQTLDLFAKETVKVCQIGTSITRVLLNESVTMQAEKIVFLHMIGGQPSAYHDSFNLAHKLWQTLPMGSEGNLALRFVALESYGSRKGIGKRVVFDKGEKAEGILRLKLARVSVLHFLFTGQEPSLPVKETMKLASSWKAGAACLAVLECLLAIKNGKKDEAKAIANRYRADPLLRKEFREGFLSYLQTGKWDKLRDSFLTKPPLGWKI